MPLTSKSAFTLAELLIALSLLGVIATFTIPKVLQTQQDRRFNAIAKEAAGMISEAYLAYQKEHGTVPTTLVPSQLTPYMNYVAFDTSTVIDNAPGQGTQTCSIQNPCVRLHNGAIIDFRDNNHFGGNATTNAISFHVDPDGQVSPAGSNGYAVHFFLYYNGRLTTKGNLLPGTANSGGTHLANPIWDPTWFQW
ncbi:MAG TPA: type II secretion system protein [Oculatellaceae cyanobacterium]|jgi:prepilin-type N-terminal cleavage/methylation domain-containing protein